MKHLWYAVIAVLCFLGTVIAEDFTTIDAMTSASMESKQKGLKILGGKVYSTYAEIEWWDYYENGDVQELKWGKTATYDSTVNLQPVASKTNTTTKITGLEPKTKYYAEFHRIYSPKADVSTKFEFTTPEATTSSLPQSLQVKPASLTLGTGIALYSITGQKIAMVETTHSMAAPLLFTGTVAPGLYIARILNASNRTIHTYQCVIGRK